jgi:hypothetical protein
MAMEDDLISSPPSSPVKEYDNQARRALRRKRSSANAALTSRPSMAALGDRNSFNMNTSGKDLVDSNSLDLLTTLLGKTSMQQDREAENGKGMAPVDFDDEEYTLSKQDCIVIHTTATGPATTSPSVEFRYALFQPNHLIDSSGSVFRIIDRDKWERMRATVEESRIIVMKATTTSSSSASEQDEAKGEGQIEHGTFDLPDDDSQSSPSTDHVLASFYIQPTIDSSASSSTSGPLLTLTIRASDSMKLQDSASWSTLPSQVKSLLQQSQDVQVQTPSSPAGTELCQRILALITPV